MPTPCVTCKPGDATRHASAVENTGCEASYRAVDECMKQHSGRVSACTEEWDLFRKCYEEGEAHKAQQKRNQ